MNTNRTPYIGYEVTRSEPSTAFGMALDELVGWAYEEGVQADEIQERFEEALDRAMDDQS